MLNFVSVPTAIVGIDRVLDILPVFSNSPDPPYLRIMIVTSSRFRICDVVAALPVEMRKFDMQIIQTDPTKAAMPTSATISL